MSTDEPQQGPAELQAWVRAQLDAGVQELMASGVFDSPMVEAKPAWVFPFEVLLGKVRVHGAGFMWLICGGVPTDCLDSSAAETPREALRHFAMKWHLGAARLGDPAVQQSLDADAAYLGQRGQKLAQLAEALYALVDDEKLWGR
jgi:Domain of unknown function (DUF4826)